MSKKELTEDLERDIILKLSQLENVNETWGQEKRVDKHFNEQYNIKAILEGGHVQFDK